MLESNEIFMDDYKKYYYLEKYLFEEVNKKFKTNKCLDSFDFFCIVIWKANRAKSRIAKNLLKNDPKQRNKLDPIVKDLTRSLYDANSEKECLEILIQKWKFRLPIATAILTVLWPNKFTIYDQRVCNILNNFNNLKNKVSFSRILEGYIKYRNEVISKVPKENKLRDKDRFLWGLSFKKNLINDIECLFNSKKYKK